MLPLLAQSRRDFFLVKGINLVVGLTVGALLLVGAGVGIGVGVAVSQPPADIVANGQTLGWRLP